ncbi:hypothetical protein [Cupriavidus taiwanensis]|uniref:PIN domain-containing protein n=1 Tax=Cupriavidus taiwanensis TaxID=164546 RepID=A0A375JC18_9BURK|nr:hypothetical protein [Cupriavidus taiwanensis]SPS01523.1 conserved hypothetical protein [Cupriavidus taiwanensis]
MAIDPSKFHPINVADTCSVWNILSSPRLNAAAKEARCDFCVTSFVQYECLIKPRKSLSASEQTLMDRLRVEQRRGAFQAHSCSIEDLQAIEILEKRKKLGKGELSSIAFAMKIRQGFITDDRKAWQLAKDSGHPHAQTTPHLFSWLIFTGRLGDGDKDTVIAQHVDGGRHIAPHLLAAYEMALQCRLNLTARP